MDPHSPFREPAFGRVRAAVRGFACAAVALLVGCGGSGGGGGDGAFLPPGLDKVAPTVVHVTPSNGTRDVGTNSPLTIAFSEPMREASLGAAIRLVDEASGAPVALRAIDYDSANQLATVFPQSPLGANRPFQASIGTDATDLSGNKLAGEHRWRFTTATGADTTPPTVTSHTPAAGATGVAAGNAIAMSFSEPMDARTVAAAFELSNGTARVAGTLESIGQAAVFKPAAALAPGATYVATLRSTATDLAGNLMAADYRWSFTTGSNGSGAGIVDTTPPTVLGVSPAPGSTNVPRDTRLIVTFSEPIFPFLYGTVDGATVDVVIDYAKNTATLIPTALLRAQVTYNSGVQARDLAGNTMPEPYRWDFATGP